MTVTDILGREYIVVIASYFYGYSKVRIYCGSYHMTVMDIRK